MLLFPHAKINLGLFITGKLPNGYHTLETVFHPIWDLKDELELTESTGERSTIEIEGIKIEGNPDENLCIRAYKLLKNHYPDLPAVHIRLQKHIPAGAGLGGGSSDAAFTLKGMKALFGLPISTEELAEMGKTLGADVPFFLYDKPLFAQGIGTDFEEIDLSVLDDYYFKLLTPPIHSSTVVAYKSLNISEINVGKSLKQILQQPIQTWKTDLVNDLEKPVFRLFPELTALKADLYANGAVYAAMSGSGSALFGIFPR